MTNSDCGWIPNETVQFIANLVDVIKVLVPVLLILMGSLDFAKAVMSQKEDEIKKSQTSFIQKLVAGVAVFFVLIFISWVFKIIDNADSSLKTGKAIRCINLMLNGGYKAEKIEVLKPLTKKTTTEKIYDQQTIDVCGKLQTQVQYNTSEEGIKCFYEVPRVYYNVKDPQYRSDDEVRDICYEDYKKNYNKCEQELIYNSQLKEQAEEFAKCKSTAKCNSVSDCLSCLQTSEIETYKYKKNKAIQTCNVGYIDIDNKDTFINKCKNGEYGTTGTMQHPFDFDNFGPVVNYYTNCTDPLISDKNKCCEKSYNKLRQQRNSCIDDMVKKSNAHTDLTKYYCNIHPNEC